MKKNKVSSAVTTILFLSVVSLLFLASCSSNSTGPPPQPAQVGPYISSISPSKAEIDSMITINGSNFSVTKSNNIVKFGTTEATVNSAAENKLTVTVPRGLSTNLTYKITETVDGETATAATMFTVAEIGGSGNPPAATGDDVPQDGILEAVTWNLDWFGSTRHGPKDEPLQVTNVITVIDSLKADLYAFEEVYNQNELDKISSHLKGYHGFTSHFSTYDGDDVHTGFSQQTAFLFNTNAIDSVSSGLITEGQDRYDWASGRYPLYFQFNYKYKDISIPFYAVVIHAKANDSDPEGNKESYERRMSAAKELHTYLQNQHPDANIIFMGDFNDDTDVSIYDESSPSPYKVFVDDTNNFKTLTKVLTAQGETSYVAGDYTDLIDQMIISNDVVPYYETSSISVYAEAQNFIPDYVNTTSDHLPVWAKFDMTR